MDKEEISRMLDKQNRDWKAMTQVYNYVSKLKPEDAMEILEFTKKMIIETDEKETLEDKNLKWATLPRDEEGRQKAVEDIKSKLKRVNFDYSLQPRRRNLHKTAQVLQLLSGHSVSEIENILTDAQIAAKQLSDFSYGYI